MCFPHTFIFICVVDVIKRCYNWSVQAGFGSRMIFFYLVSIIPLVGLSMYNLFYADPNYVDQYVSSFRLSLGELLRATVYAPIFETLFFQVLLTKYMSWRKYSTPTIIGVITVLFALAHYTNGAWAPLVVLIPALVFSWNYYLYFNEGNGIIGFILTTIIHSAYNFTLLVVFPMIYLVLKLFYGQGFLF